MEVMTWHCTSVDSGIWWKLLAIFLFFTFFFLFFFLKVKHTTCPASVAPIANFILNHVCTSLAAAGRVRYPQTLLWIWRNERVTILTVWETRHDRAFTSSSTLYVHLKGIDCVPLTSKLSAESIVQHWGGGQQHRNHRNAVSNSNVQLA